MRCEGQSSTFYFLKNRIKMSNSSGFFIIFINVTWSYLFKFSEDFLKFILLGRKDYSVVQDCYNLTVQYLEIISLPYIT